ncbi:hypothetical protein CALVIDRAFT_251165 [Calocera viscosa TUFC12733]|uniref:Carbohydrate-binding module family 18 protein n=1 Tax=Calocera viscosa (strain TUFC12733) TaxID=1330018 RepID=A0A167JFF6_CALVF|nr:hypothetical protein CALVIDRAFT_251165 [Calocera viscosa TUFC12733]
MVAPRLLILLLNLVCLASLGSVVAQNAVGAAAAGLIPCSNDAACAAHYGSSAVHCAPDGYCADAGAACSGVDSCYDLCGPDGICGGVGAACDTNDQNDYQGYKCAASSRCPSLFSSPDALTPDPPFSPPDFCTGTFTKDFSATGVCEPSGPSGSSAAAAGLTACSSDATCVTAFQPGVYCAPDGYCGDTGAACSADVDCWDICGSNGVCGGAGAECDTADNDDYTGYKCAYGCRRTSHFSSARALTLCLPPIS